MLYQWVSDDKYICMDCHKICTMDDTCEHTTICKDIKEWKYNKESLVPRNYPSKQLLKDMPVELRHGYILAALLAYKARTAIEIKVDASSRIKEGIAKAREKGVVLGRRKLPSTTINEVLLEHSKGKTRRQIAKSTNVSVGAVQKIISESTGQIK